MVLLASSRALTAITGMLRFALPLLLEPLRERGEKQRQGFDG